MNGDGRWKGKSVLRLIDYKELREFDSAIFQSGGRRSLIASKSIHLFIPTIFH